MSDPQTTMSEQLLPCPFCGADAQLMIESSYYFGGCTNDDCRAEALGHVTREPAIAAWNRRAVAAPTFSAASLYLIKKALQRYRTRIEEVAAMGWYDSPSVTDQELARVDTVLAQVEVQP